MKIYANHGDVLLAADLDTAGEVFVTEGFDGGEPEAGLRFKLSTGEVVEFAGDEFMGMLLCAAGRR
jgi:hypothetical protein